MSARHYYQTQIENLESKIASLKLDKRQLTNDLKKEQAKNYTLMKENKELAKKT